MPVEVILPKVDMDMTHGTVAVWHVAPGTAVVRGQALFDIETDKAAMEVEAPASGRLMEVTAGPGDRVAVGTVVARIYAEGEVAAEGSGAAGPAVPDGAAPGAGEGGVEVILPKVDMDMSHGTLAVWHVAEGQPVTKGAALFDIETDKAAMEVEAPASGVLHHVAVRPGERVPVGSTVAWIYPAGVTPPERSAPASVVGGVPDPVRAAPSVSTVATGGADEPGVTAAGVRATPAARAVARRAGIDLAGITGTGPRGRIQKDDVEAAIARAAPAAGDDLGRNAEAAPPAGWTAQPGALHVSVRPGTGGDVPLVLLHGFTADSQSWAPLEKALGSARTLIRVDLPGHGRSPRRRVAGFADLARMVVEAVDAATAEHAAFDLLGHSLGGALALAVADIRPRRVRSVCLIAPAGLGPEVDAAALLGIARAGRAESLAPWLRRLTATPAAISDDYARAAMRSRADGALRAYQQDLADILFPDGVQPFDLRPALARLDCPATLVWGRMDHILPWRQAIAVLGDFALHLLPEAGHVPQIECPDRLARLLLRHLSAATVR